MLNETADPAVIADLLFLEAWERGSMFSIAATMRAAQIRRANPELAAQIGKEVRQIRSASSGYTAALSLATVHFPSIPDDNVDGPDPKTDDPEASRNSELPCAAQQPPGTRPSARS